GQTWTKTQTIKRTAAGGVGGGTQSVSVGDYVWLDTDANGRQDAGEHGIPGVTLKLTGPTGAPVTGVGGQVVGPTVTDAQGKYLFSGLPVLPAGQHYTVTIDRTASGKALDGLTPTREHVGDTQGDSSTWTAESTDLTTDGASDLTLDFGFHAVPTPTPTPTDPATTTPGGQVVPDPPATPAHPAAAGTGDPVALAHTGSDIALPIVAAVVLLALGLGGVLLGRRRRPAHRGQLHG
ncbi:MAG: LPXTG cell wall anchor domain-containing protein, partial [Actinobacteria bacterium]|nr:LPXTG cell wall anchor domain-containing protein [Actinomycetota bacterium]